MAMNKLVAQLDPSLMEPQAEDMVDPATGVPKMGGAPDYGNQLLSMMNSPEHQALMQQAKESIAQQRAGIPQSEKILENAQNQAKLRPLANLSDQWFGGNMSSNYASPEDIAKLQQGLQQQRQGLTTEQINLLKNATDQNMAKMFAVNERLKQRQTALGYTEDKMASSAVDKVMNDKLLNAAVPRVQGLNRIDNQIQAALNGKFKLTPQFMKDVNNEYAAAMTGKNNYAEGTAEGMSYNNAATKLTNLKQYVESNVQNLNTPEVVDQINKQVKSLKGDWAQAVNERAKMLQREYKHSPYSTQAQEKAIKNIMETYGSGGATPEAPSKIKVSNGKETLAIDPSDLENALKEGYKKQ